MTKAKRRKAGNKNAAGLPGWMHMASGLAIGLAVAWGIYVSDRRQPPVPVAAPAASQPASPPAEVTEIIPAESEARVTFDFYDMLPNLDVELYENAGMARPAQPGQLPAEAAESYDDSPAVDPPVAPTRAVPATRSLASSTTSSTALSRSHSARVVEKPGIYILQAGSFASLEVAQRRRAEIGALGVHSEIKKGEVNDKTVYRVYTDPMDKPEDVNRVSTLLTGTGIDILLKRVSD